MASSFVGIPHSPSTVNVSITDVCTISNVPVDALYTPPIPGLKYLAPAPSFCFLIEHASGKKVLYDLGIRKDWENLPPRIVERFKKVGHRPQVKKNVSEVLDEGGTGKHRINAVIWSHAHWDHTGDMSTFPPTTDLVVGRGFKEHFLGNGEGVTSNLGGILPSDVEGRTLREISFDKGPQTLQIGKFLAYDYFNDGSLYLLDSPGHCVGHVCALARTTTSPETFVFLGGDVAHHCAEVRPSYYVPLPETITLDPRNLPLYNNNSVPFCPGAWFEDLQTSRGRDPKGSLFQPAFGHNMEEALESIEKVQHLDGEQNIFVILAHDTSLRSSEVNFYPDKINDWKSRGLGDLFRWTWIGDILNSLKGGKHDETR